VLVECGFTVATAPDGSSWSFTPSLGRIASLGTPYEVVDLFAALHGPNAAQAAAYVLACLCDQEDVSPLIGWHELEPDAPRWVPGLMPAAEQIVIARHLMRHGIVGKARPDQAGSGDYSDRFDAAEYVAAARVHLGMSAADAEALSMSEFQLMLEMKFPDAARKVDIPSAEEYEAAMARLKERQHG
jgi:hypothetical protein